VRVLDSNGAVNALLFTFIEKDKVLPLDQVRESRQ